jgi:hypothetical protein
MRRGSRMYPHFPVIGSRGVGFEDVDISVLDMDQFAGINEAAAVFLELIMDYQNERGRVSIRELTRRARAGELVEPTPLTYHREYSANYLAKSFQGEPLPGVYLPCSSRMSETEALVKFVEVNCTEPNTIVDLNKFIEESFPVTAPEWDPTKHASHIRPYSLEFYSRVGIPLLPPGFASIDSDRRAVPYTPYNWELARQRLNIFPELLKPLIPYMADPLLTTLMPHSDIYDCFLGLSLSCPDGTGRLVCRTRPFYKSSMSYPKVSQQTVIGKCSYCEGIYLLPCQGVVLCYYVPDELKVVTADIKTAWNRGQISVCAVHFLHKATNDGNGILRDIDTTF